MFNQSSKQLTFAGHPVTMRVVGGNEVLIHCKNVTGTFSQAKSFVNNTNPSNIYPWGVKTTAPASISHAPGGNVEIACLRDSRDKFMELYHECENLLGI